jgi:hypothetical protein
MLSRQAVARGDVARRLVEAVFAFADRFGPASVYWLTQEYNGPARSLYDTVAHRTSFVVYRPELGRKISDSTAERRLPWADPLRCAEAQLAVFAGFTQAYWSTPQHESHRRQGRRREPDQDQQGSDQRGRCCGQHARGSPSALRDATASVLGDALGIAGRQVFHRYALFVPSGVLSGSMACVLGQREGE